MPLKTTTIGSMPLPSCLKIPRWFEINNYSTVMKEHSKFLCTRGETNEFREEYEKAVKETLAEQAELGIDVITDGELDRESYVWYLCRHLDGISFKNLELCSFRNGACFGTLPQVISPIGVGTACDVMVKHWTFAQAHSPKPVKATIPGPLTVIGSSQNKFYLDEKQLSLDLAAVINKILKELVAAGCRHIQLDEPVFMREVERSLDFGIGHATKCIAGIGSEVTKTLHMCCGYPDSLDQTDYIKADADGYFKLADKIDEAGFDEVSIEDAHRRNNLSLLTHFKQSKVVLGTFKTASSEIEPVCEIRSRLESALNFIPRDRLVVAPDCGLGFLPHDIMRQKLKNMVEAAKSIP